MRLKDRRSLVALGVLALVTGCVLIGALAVGFARVNAIASRPLVLIHSPHSRTPTRVGDGVIIHATARAENGLARIELWADHRLLAAYAAPGEAPSTNLVLSETWVPRLPGNHLLTARAVTANGIDGQATVAIVAMDTGEPEATGLHTVGEGETLDSIAADLGVTPEEVAALNPELDPEGLAEGDTLVVPDRPDAADGETGDGFPGGDGPEAEDASPGSLDAFLEYLRLSPFRPPPPTDPTSNTLRVEILELTTDAAYERLHCYVELAGQAPRWVPDADDAPATDESFASLGDGAWDVAEHFAGDAAPVLAWPGDQPLPLATACVGIAGGGTDALELGRLDLTVPAVQWNSTPRTAESSGEEGSYRLVYRVTRLGGAPRGVPLYLDPDMTSPTNARLDARRALLLWDYRPVPEEEAIHGFRIYLNGTLQWIEPPDARQTLLPFEWLHPACGSTYTFGVTAFRYAFPDGPESYPAIAIAETPLEDCHREVEITFLTLETFDLGGDNRSEPHHGDVGPVYGTFYANEQFIPFDARSRRGGGSLDMPNGLRHNTVYDISRMAADSSWHFVGDSRLLVDVPPEGSFQFGFTILDSDAGGCRHPGEYGCDDLVCEATSVPIPDDIYGELDRWHEGTLTSDEGRCRMTYTFRPAFGSPVGTGAEGWMPLPWLSVTDVRIEETTGRVRIHLRNTGSAGWPYQDLDVELQTRSGEALGLYTYPDFAVLAGRAVVLEDPAMVIPPPLDACVVIDPYDEVVEELEYTGAMFHDPVCPSLPDLTITDAYCDAAGGRLRVTVHNVGEGAVENRTLQFRTLLADGSRAYIDGSWPDVSLGPGEGRIFDLSGVDERGRERLRDGYSVIVNPESTIGETNVENNSFTIPAGASLRLVVTGIRVPYAYRDQVEYHLEAQVVAGSTRRTVADLHVEQADIDWGTCYPGTCVASFHDNEYLVRPFDLFGDESLVVEIRVDHPGSLLRILSANEVFDAEADWGAGPPDAYRSCGSDHSGPGIHTPTLGWHADEAWRLEYQICHVYEGE